MRPRPRNEVRKIELKLFELDEPMKLRLESPPKASEPFTNTRVLMGVPNSQLTTNFVARYRLITVFFWPIISKLLTPLVPSYMCFGYKGHQRSTICSTISFHDISWYTPVFLETISFWEIFTGKGGSRQPKLYLY